MNLLKLFVTINIVLICIDTNSQIISKFTWDSAPVTAADIGPDGTSVSASAISDAGGVGGTNGLNAGLPKADFTLTIPGSPTFDIDGIDVSFDYQREEASGTFLKRGSSLIIQGCSNISVSFRIEDGMGGYTTVSSGNVYPIPDDDIYRNYRFYYMPETGEAAILVNDVAVWTNDGPDGRNLYWTGSGNLIVGAGMDGTGFNNTFMDNLIIANIFNSPLPIELIDFTANYSEFDQSVICEWQTASEINNDFFNIERSVDCENWEQIGQVGGAGNSSSPLTYSFQDKNPNSSISYYRLKQTDFDGSFSYSEIRTVNLPFTSDELFIIFPNPTKNEITISIKTGGWDEVKLYNSIGQQIKIDVPNGEGNIINLNLDYLEKGIYFICVNESIQRLIIQ